MECQTTRILQRTKISYFAKLHLYHAINQYSKTNYKCYKYNEIQLLLNNKREKIKRLTLITNKFERMDGIINLNTYIKTLKMKWIKTNNTNDDANWKVL